MVSEGLAGVDRSAVSCYSAHVSEVERVQLLHGQFDLYLRDLARSLARYWPILLAMLTGFVYGVGYLKGYILLRSLGVTTTPTEVFAPATLLVSGLSTCAMASAFPLTLFFVLYFQERLICWAISHWYRAVLVIFGGAAVMGAALYLFFSTPRDLATFPVPYGGGLVECAVVSVLAGAVVFCAFMVVRQSMWPRWSPRARISLFCVALTVWFLLHMWTYSLQLRDAQGVFRRSGQDPGVFGVLVTDQWLGDGSRLSSDSTHFCTPGVLLGARGGVWHLARVEPCRDSAGHRVVSRGLAVVPEGRVLSFIEFGDSMELYRSSLFVPHAGSSPDTCLP